MEQQIIGILQSLRPEYTFDRSSRLIEDGMLDSFDLTLLVAELDQCYGISIDGVDIVPEHFASLDTIMALLKKYGVDA